MLRLMSMVHIFWCDAMHYHNSICYSNKIALNRSKQRTPRMHWPQRKWNKNSSSVAEQYKEYEHQKNVCGNGRKTTNISTSIIAIIIRSKWYWKQRIIRTCIAKIYLYSKVFVRFAFTWARMHGLEPPSSLLLLPLPSSLSNAHLLCSVQIAQCAMCLAVAPFDGLI